MVQTSPALLSSEEFHSLAELGKGDTQRDIPQNHWERLVVLGYALRRLGGLSLSQIKSGHIGGGALQELGDKECVRPVPQRARSARPSPRIDACVPHYNI
jgi:hypothetical protein